MTNIALMALLLLPTPTAPRAASTAYRPRIEVWTNRGEAVYTRGQPARVSFRTNADAYVTILRVDTDGRVRMLFPRDPEDDNFARGGREYEVDGGARRHAFSIDDYPGVGYVFAVASADPFEYNAVVSGDHWDYRMITAGRVRGDPYVALTEFAEQIVPRGSTDWDYDVVPYYVERHYDYPRFLCYDCHGYASWTHWNPYYASCVRFRIVVYDNPWYYPYRRYRGTRVVFVRPFRPEPSFIFKDRAGPSNQPFVSHERDRSANDVSRRPVNDVARRGVRGRDLGGVGVIPPPRQRADIVRPGQPVQPDRPGRPDRPDNRPDNRPDRPENRPDRPDNRPDRPDNRPDRPDNRPDQPNRPDRPDRPDERPDRPNRPDRPDNRPDQPNRPDRPDRPEERPDRPDNRPDQPNRPDRPERPDRPDQPSRPDRPDQPARPNRPDQGEQSRPTPRREPSAEPARGRGPERAAPPRAEPKRDSSRDEPERSKPELKRRRSD